MADIVKYILLCRGRAVAVAAFEDRIAVFPTSIAAGNNIVDKVAFLLFCNWRKSNS